MTIPKTILNHPGVAECCAAMGTDEIEAGGPRYDVLLRDGWTFTGKHEGEGRMTAFFRTVADFRAAAPVRKGE